VTVDDETFVINLEPATRAAGDARRELRTWLPRVRFPSERLDDLLLLVSELVTNAVIHAETRLRLVVRYDGRRVLTEVFDGDPHLPRPLPTPRDVGGRGLSLVEALSSRWGSETVGLGKRVWAELLVPA
jgi:anti-sigma regulatory factor (Ser/Thr protein kinase)